MLLCPTDICSGVTASVAVDFFFLQFISQNLAMNECKARNKELHLHIEELQMRVGGRGECGVCTRNVGKVWSVYQDKESWPGSIARMRDSL